MTKSNEEKAKAAKDCLDYNKKLSEVHVTHDLNCFPNKNDAVNHASKLEEKSIDTFQREEEKAAEAN